MLRDTYPIFPFYLVIDVSGSMETCLPAINAELPVLQREISQDPIVGEIARFAVVSFAKKAVMEFPLSDLLEVDAMPQLHAEGPTNYRKVFEFMNGCIPHDMAWFEAEGFQMYRPAIFFVTDGIPTDRGWEEAYEELTAFDNPFRPNIVTFGFGDADAQTLRTVATFRAYIAREGQSPTVVLKTIAKELTRSILASSQSAANGSAVLSLPDDIAGMQALDVG